MAKIKPEIGDLVSVLWNDATGVINQDVTTAGLSKCISYGILTKMDKKEIQVVHCIYEDGSTGDSTQIPRGWDTEIKRIRKAPRNVFGRKK